MKPSRGPECPFDMLAQDRDKPLNADVLASAPKGGEHDAESECARSRPGAGQDPAKRRQILEGAQNVFLRMGFDAASMNDITREAGVSKGTIYVYFNSKEDLFVSLCDHYRQTTFGTLLEKLDKGFSNREELIDFGIALVTLITSKTAIRAQRIVLGVSERKPELATRFYERGPKRSLVAMADHLGRMIEAGVLEPLDTHRVAYQLSDLFLSGLYRPRLFGAMAEPPSEETIRANVETAVDFFFRAYGKRG